MAGSAVADFGEIRRLLGELPGPDLDAQTAAATRQRGLAAPPGALGRLEALVQWLAAWQGRHPPQLHRPRVAVFAGSHGVAGAETADASGMTTRQALQNVIDGGAAVNQLCAEADADLRAYEMALDAPTADWTRAPAMSEADCARAMAYGMMAVEDGFDVMAVGDVGAAGRVSAAAMGCALFGGEPADWIDDGDGGEEGGGAGRGRGELVAAGLARHAGALDDPLEVLRRLGGPELAAIAGAIMACRLARTPVLLDGFACTAAAAVLFRLDPRALDHCQAAHGADGHGHARLLAALGMGPLLGLGLRAGEAAGASLAIPLLKAACACHAGMATLAEIGLGEQP